MTEVESFNVLDTKWQVDEAYPPNKESTWPYPKEKDGWIYAHDSLREEVIAIKEALKKVAQRDDLPDWAIASIKACWSGHYRHIDAHHRNEDELFAPFASKRFHWPEKGEADHKQIVELLNRVTKLTDELSKKCEVDELIKEIEEYEAVLFPHLKEEEVVCLPLTRAYFTQGDISPLIQKIIANGPKEEMGSFIYWMGEKAFRNEFMKQENIPFFVWYLVFRGRLAYYRSHMTLHINALNSGEPPKKTRGLLRWLFG